MLLGCCLVDLGFFDSGFMVFGFATEGSEEVMVYVEKGFGNYDRAILTVCFVNA